MASGSVQELWQLPTGIPEMVVQYVNNACNLDWCFLCNKLMDERGGHIGASCHSSMLECYVRPEMQLEFQRSILPMMWKYLPRFMNQEERREQLINNYTGQRHLNEDNDWRREMRKRKANGQLNWCLQHGDGGVDSHLMGRGKRCSPYVPYDDDNEA